MANFNLSNDNGSNQLYGSLGNLLGTGLGGLGSYINQEYQAPEIERQLKGWGANDDQAKYLARRPEERARWVQQQQKMLAQEQKNAQLAAIYRGDTLPNAGGQPNPIQPNETPPLNEMTQPTENVAPQSKFDKKLDAEMRKATRDMDREGKMRLLQSNILDERQREVLMRQLEMERGNDLREARSVIEEEKPIRKEIRDQTKTWKNEYKKAESDIHALDELKTLDNDDFTPHTIRRIFTKAGLGDYFLGAKEEAYKKIVEGLVMDRASELVSTGKMTAAMLDRVRLRFPSLENSPEGRDVINNILNRESEEKKVYHRIFNQLKKKEQWSPNKEPLDIVDRVEELAEPEIRNMRLKANEQLRKDVGLSDQEDEIITTLNTQQNPSKLPEGRIAKVGGKPVAKIVNGKWEVI